MTDIRGNWSSRPVQPGQYDLDELVFEEIVNGEGVPVALVIDTAEADGNAYGHAVRAAIIDVPAMLDLLQEVITDRGLEPVIANDVQMLLRKHGRI